MINNNIPYNSFNKYLKRFGKSVWRIPLDVNFTCPNRDGARGYGGCTFCTADGSSAQLQNKFDSIADQLANGIMHKRRRYKAEKFIAYLQSFTNTYAPDKPLSYLKNLYDEAINHEDIVMLAIGTRPDALNDEILELINSYTDKVEVWLDLGVQSIHEETLTKINRGHSAQEYIDWIYKIKDYNPDIKICSHMMAGFPWETLEDAYQTGLALSKLPIDGIKIHNLLILEETKLAIDYKRGLITDNDLINQQDYMDLVIKILSILPPSITIHRLQAEAPRNEQLIAPKWSNNKDNFLQILRDQMNNQNIYQGSELNNTPTLQ